jgi:transposase-like protein
MPIETHATVSRNANRSEVAAAVETDSRNAKPEIVSIPVAQLGIYHRTLVRPINKQAVAELADTDETMWAPLEVRHWPDDYGTSESDEVIYHVMSGNHRRSAASLKKLECLPCVILDAPTEADYLTFAIKSNTGHGRNFTEDERRMLAAQLKAQGKAPAEIAHMFKVSQSTVYNWLSGRDTNASRKRAEIRDHHLTPMGAIDYVPLPRETHDERVKRKVQGLIMDAQFEAGVTEARAYIRTLKPAQQEALCSLTMWLQQVMEEK